MLSCSKEMSRCQEWVWRTSGRIVLSFCGVVGHQIYTKVLFSKSSLLEIEVIDIEPGILQGDQVQRLGPFKVNISPDTLSKSDSVEVV
jgi:hypothetical protein